MLRYEGVIFDMDGTLIDSPLDFDMIRSDLGVPSDEGILEWINTLPPEQQERLMQQLLRHEMTAVQEAKLSPGAIETLQAIRQAGLKTALLTRNAAPIVKIIMEKFDLLRFDLTFTREDGPIKPEPDGILRACRDLDIIPERTLCVGDYRYDLVAAKNAGSSAVLLARKEVPDYADLADFVISDLRELLNILGIEYRKS
jgi:HAD superfamily hydrolase (TIGR01509 family)